MQNLYIDKHSRHEETAGVFHKLNRKQNVPSMVTFVTLANEKSAPLRSASERSAPG